MVSDLLAARGTSLAALLCNVLWIIVLIRYLRYERRLMNLIARTLTIITFLGFNNIVIAIFLFGWNDMEAIRIMLAFFMGLEVIAALAGLAFRFRTTSDPSRYQRRRRPRRHLL